MRRFSSVSLAAAAISVALGLPAAENALPPCIGVAAFARYGAYGYDHIVTIKNDCGRAAECVVSTNVNPDPIGVRVQAGTTESVLTFRGSPASQFSARVSCALER